MVADAPSHNDGVTMMTCLACGNDFKASGRRLHCSDACRQAAFRRRHAVALPAVSVPPKGRKREMTVYECGSCGARELGLQRCESCNSWMSAVGVGNNCPGCGEPFSVTEFMEGTDS
jgi:predicted amidophosphoribosyltransferase